MCDRFTAPCRVTTAATLSVVACFLATALAPGARAAQAPLTGASLPSAAVIEKVLDREIARLADTQVQSLRREELKRTVLAKLSADQSRFGGSSDPEAAVATLGLTIHEIVADQTLRSTAFDVYASAIGDGERTALIDLYNTTGGAAWTDRTNWRNAEDTDFNAPGTECTWFGVTCNVAGLNVVRLGLLNNNLVGTLPPSLGSLSRLRDLYLAYNQLSGEIPESLGDLSMLQSIYLYMNQLTGPIPATLGDLGNLDDLDLGVNPLTGSFPPELGNLSNLRSLNLSGTQISGDISPEIQKLTKLEWLNLSFMPLLTGSIPAWLGNLSNLWYLALQNYSGSIPAELGNLSNLEFLNLSGSELTGTIPASLGGLSKLTFLGLSCQGLTDPIPTELGNLSQLQKLRLGSLQFSGPIPAWIGNLANLQDLWVMKSGFSGPIPDWIGDLSNLQYLRLGSNQLTGTIPSELASLTNLHYLLLYDNQLSGSIPTALGNLTTLEHVALNVNRLTGSIPTELANLTNLKYLALGSNRLSGPIPPELGDLTSLLYLFLNSNQLTGAVPDSITDLTSLGTGLSDFRWNGLYSSDPAVVTFLDDKQIGGDWQSTQTVPITDLTLRAATPFTAVLSWAPILYTGDTGGYQAFYSTPPAGPYTPDGITRNKSASSIVVRSLDPDTTYYVVIRTVTNPHDNNQNTVTSDPSDEVSFSTTAISPHRRLGPTH